MNWWPVVIIVFAVACPRATAGTPSAEVPDIADVRFPEGQPTATGNFEPSPELLTSMNDALQAFSNFPKLTVNVVGHTDSKECAGRACTDLGLRRAQYVYDWLDLHGVNRIQLGTVMTTGSDAPVSSNDDDRRLNRRVSFEILPEHSKPIGGKP